LIEKQNVIVKKIGEIDAKLFFDSKVLIIQHQFSFVLNLKHSRMLERLAYTFSLKAK